jgi:RNA polymerase sigma factor (sigma-70 family)
MDAGRLQPLVRFARQTAGAGLLASLSDVELLGRFARGRDGGAFAALVRRHGPVVLGACRRVVGDYHVAEDCLQATFLVLARRAGSLRRPEALGPWLYGVACRTARKARVRRARALARDRRAARPTAQEQADEVAGRELSSVLDEAVCGLPARYRVPFVLHHLEGLPVAEVARRLRCPSGTVCAHLARARTRLRAWLVRRGLAPAAATLAGLGQVAGAELAPGLANATARAAVLGLASWGAAAGAVSPQVILLAKGGLGTMLTSKLAVALFTLAGAAGVASVGAWGYQDRAQPGGENSARPAAAAKPKPHDVQVRPVEPPITEQLILQALREKGWWHSPAGDFTLRTPHVEGRRLRDLTMEQGTGLNKQSVTVSEAEIRVDEATGVLHLRVLVLGTWQDVWISLRTGRYTTRDPGPEPKAEVDRLIWRAFGPGCAEVHLSHKLHAPSQGLVIAGESCVFECGQQVCLRPCRLVLYKGPAAGTGMVTVTAEEVRLTFDGPVRDLNDVGRGLAGRGGLHLRAFEPAGNVRISMPADK